MLRSKNLKSIATLAFVLALVPALDACSAKVNDSDDGVVQKQAKPRGPQVLKLDNDTTELNSFGSDEGATGAFGGDFTYDPTAATQVTIAGDQLATFTINCDGELKTTFAWVELDGAGVQVSRTELTDYKKPYTAQAGAHYRLEVRTTSAGACGGASLSFKAHGQPL